MNTSFHPGGKTFFTEGERRDRKQPKSSDEQQRFWITPHALLYYICWEMAWYQRDENGTKICVPVSEVHACWKTEYGLLRSNGVVPITIVKDEFSTLPKQMDIKKGEFYIEQVDERESVIEDTESADIKPEQDEEFYERTGVLAPAALEELTPDGHSTIPTVGIHTKISTIASIYDVIKELLEWQKLGILQLLPCKRIDEKSLRAHKKVKSKLTSSPSKPLCVSFNDARGAQIFRDLFDVKIDGSDNTPDRYTYTRKTSSGASSDTFYSESSLSSRFDSEQVPHIIKSYHKQRMYRYAHYTKVFSDCLGSSTPKRSRSKENVCVTSQKSTAIKKSKVKCI